MLTAIGMSLLQIYLWGLCIVAGLFLVFGGLLLAVVKTSGKKPEKDGQKRSALSELFGLLRMAAFFGVLWPYMAGYLLCILLRQLVPQYAEDIRRHQAKKAKEASAL